MTDGEQRAALAVVRSLGRAGYRVIVAAGTSRSLSGASRFATERLVTPDPLTHPEAFAAAVERAVRTGGLAWVLPITEAANLALLSQRESLRPARIPGPRASVFARAADKEAVLRAGESAGIAVPRQLRLTSPAGAEAALGTLRYPVVVKPARSVGETLGRREKLSVRHAADGAQLAGVLGALPDAAFPVLVQERIVGPGVGLFFLRWNGRIVARFAHRRLREKPPSGGVSVLCESLPLDPELFGAAETLLADLEWEGVAMVELKLEAATGRPYLMEINGRFWGSLQLAIDAGVDFPRLLLEAASGRAPAQPPAWRSGVRSRWLWGDLDHLLLRLLRSPDRLALPPDAPGRAGALLRFLDWRPWREHDAVFRVGDPRPFFRESVDWIRAL